MQLIHVPANTRMAQLEAFLTIVNDKAALTKTVKVMKDAESAANDAITKANAIAKANSTTAGSLTGREATLASDRAKVEAKEVSNEAQSKANEEDRRQIEADQASLVSQTAQANSQAKANIKSTEEALIRVEKKIKELDNREAKVATREKITKEWEDKAKQLGFAA